MSVILGRQSKLSSFDSTSRMVSEIISSPDPRAVIVQRIRVGDSLPGFGSSLYPRGDPRARALLGFCNEVLASDRSFQRLSVALATVREINGQEPEFSLACIFVGTTMGLGRRESLFHVGRAAGWIAHAIEQYQYGEVKRQRGLYKGPLP
jgi:citrate synthase